MRILIVEDEQPAAGRLAKLLEEHWPEAEIEAMIESVEGAVRHLSTHSSPDLIFLDIQLADGLSFDIFGQVEVSAPVIFTTAFDQYTLRAFRVNSIDYLLKPIDPEELVRAQAKYRQFFGRPAQHDPRLLQQIAALINQPTYKERFLVKTGQQLTYLKVTDIFYFYSEDGIVFAQTAKSRRHPLDYTLDQLQELLDPADFFRINRKIIVRVEAIAKISPYFNSRLTMELNPPPGFEVIISRDRVTDFKAWLDR